MENEDKAEKAVEVVLPDEQITEVELSDNEPKIKESEPKVKVQDCLLYTSDAADE